MAYGNGLENLMELSLPVFSGVAWSYFVSGTGHYQGFSYRPVIPFVTRFTSKKLWTIRGQLLRKYSASYASRGQLLILTKSCPQFFINTTSLSNVIVTFRRSIASFGRKFTLYNNHVLY